MLYICVLCVLFFNDTASTEIYTYLHTLSLNDALPIYPLLVDPGVAGSFSQCGGLAGSAHPGAGRKPDRFRDPNPARRRELPLGCGDRDPADRRQLYDRGGILPPREPHVGPHRSLREFRAGEAPPSRSDERRAGKECLSTCRYLCP